MIKSQKNKITIYFVILILLSIIKFTYFNYSTPDSIYFEKLDNLYKQALTENFFNFTYFFHTKPIGPVIKDGILLLISDKYLINNLILTSFLIILQFC